VSTSDSVNTARPLPAASGVEPQSPCRKTDGAVFKVDVVDETLMKKVEATRFPSTEMLNRLDRPVARLDELEQQQQRRRQLEQARDNE